MAEASTKLTLQRVIIALSVLLCLIRFVALESSPPGFYSDEAAGATNIICLTQENTNKTGVRFPLFLSALNSGLFTPVYLYFGNFWISIFGSSIGSFRAISAFFSVLTLFGLYLLSKQLSGAYVAAWVLLASSLSPWSAQFSRIAWDPPLMPCFLIWGTFLLIRGRSYLDFILSGVLFALALYSYPTARVQFPLLFGFLIIYQLKRREISWKNLALVSAVILVSSSPLIYMTLSGSLQGRFNLIGIFSPNYLSKFEGENWQIILSSFASNFIKHFDLNYLFIRGDKNLRHATGAFGECSILDICAVLIVIDWGVMRFFRSCPDNKSSNFRFVVSLSVFGFISGIVPAALTWEALPHALRSIGAWPFLGLFTGSIIARTDRLQIPLFLFALAFAASFWIYYFKIYPLKSQAWFDSHVKSKAIAAKQSGNWEDFKIKDYDQMALRYYRMHYQGLSCSDSRNTQP